MKTIRWAGVALIASAAAVAVFLVATPVGAYVWQTHFAAKRLTPAQKTGVAQIIQCAAPGIPVAAIKDWRCEVTHPTAEVDAWVCRGSGSATMTEEAYVQALIAGTVGPYETRSGGNVTVPVRTVDIPMAGSCLTLQNTWIGAVWSGHSNASIQAYYAARNPSIAGAVDAEADALVTGTAAEYLNAGGGTATGPTVVGQVE